MNKEEFLISTNIIYQSLNSNEINAYSKKQLEQNYSIDIEDYVSSKSTLTQLLNEKGNLDDFMHIIFSIINLNQKKNKKRLQKNPQKGFVK